MTDQRAIKLLTKACWSSAGWKPTLDLTADELAYLEAAGQAPPDRTLTHDGCLAWAKTSLERVSRDQVRKAFVWSLTTRQLEFRSALGSFANLHRMPDHPFARVEKMHYDHCETCCTAPSVSWTQRDSVVANFQRHKWGGVAHDDLRFMACDLELFARLPPVSPTPNDWLALRAIVEAAAEPATGKSVGALKKAVKGVIKSNDSEADALLHILSYAGVLATEANPGFDKRFVRFIDRRDLRGASDQKYPLNCWKGPGYRPEALRYWFPEIADA